MQHLDQTLPIYSYIGLGHWAVYKNADENPEFPWFVEHRLVDNEHDLRWPHDADEHEHGSYRTWEGAFTAALMWFDAECRDYEDNEEWKR